MEFKISNTQVFGINRAIRASGNPMRTKISDKELTNKDYQRAIKLGTTNRGEGHDNFLKGIIVQMDVTAPLYWWKQAQRYHWFDFISSQSTMHKLLKFDVAKQCTKDVDNKILNRYKYLVNNYNKSEVKTPKMWRELVASLPCGFCLTATMTTNYQQLKTMYYQRKYHKLEEWHSFCKWCEALPNFKTLVVKDNGNNL